MFGKPKPMESTLTLAASYILTVDAAVRYAQPGLAVGVVGSDGLAETLASAPRKTVEEPHRSLSTN